MSGHDESNERWQERCQQLETERDRLVAQVQRLRSLLVRLNAKLTDETRVTKCEIELALTDTQQNTEMTVSRFLQGL